MSKASFSLIFSEPCCENGAALLLLFFSLSERNEVINSGLSNNCFNSRSDSSFMIEKRIPEFCNDNNDLRLLESVFSNSSPAS